MQFYLLKNLEEILLNLMLIAQANTVQSALAAIRKINKDLTLDDELRFINSVRRLGVEETINQMLDEMLEKEKN